jgi:tripartite-type tricarboxylate transporter receptor subunit TctC
MGQPTMIDNRPGAGGRIAAELRVKSEPDGYTLFVSTGRAAIHQPALIKAIPYDAEKAYLPVTRVAEKAAGRCALRQLWQRAA